MFYECLLCMLVCGIGLTVDFDVASSLSNGLLGGELSLWSPYLCGMSVLRLVTDRLYNYQRWSHCVLYVCVWLGYITS